MCSHQVALSGTTSFHLALLKHTVVCAKTWESLSCTSIKYRETSNFFISHPKLRRIHKDRDYYALHSNIDVSYFYNKYFGLF